MALDVEVVLDEPVVEALVELDIDETVMLDVELTEDDPAELTEELPDDVATELEVVPDELRIELGLELDTRDDVTEVLKDDEIVIGRLVEDELLDDDDDEEAEFFWYTLSLLPAPQYSVELSIMR